MRRSRLSGGFVLIAMAICLIMIIGILGLCLDLGRLYVVKNELQAYVDAAALAANKELDGTDDGVTRARAMATTYPNRWNFSTLTVKEPQVSFATAPGGPWVESPPSPPEEYRYTRVEAEGGIRMYFLPIFGLWDRGFSTSTGFWMAIDFRSPTLKAESLAGQIKVTWFAQNLLPYSPDAHLDPGRTPVYNPGYTTPDPFNFKIGHQYTLRWPPPGQRDNPGFWCEGDREANFVSPSPAPERGFIDIGEIPGSGGSSYIRQAIVSNVQTHPIQEGDYIINVTGNRETESDALRERVSTQDTDNYSRTWAEYSANKIGTKRVGNGRRVVFVPVNNPYAGDVVVEFATFFLPIADEVCGVANTAPCCAEYIGAGLLHEGKPATKVIGVYNSRLLK